MPCGYLHVQYTKWFDLLLDKQGSELRGEVERQEDFAGKSQQHSDYDNTVTPAPASLSPREVQVSPLILKEHVPRAPMDV
jgi:hypothetical protein